MIVNYLLLDPFVEVPSNAYSGDAGLDIRANESVELLPQGPPVLVKTGFKMAFPEGYAALVLPRSGLACKFGVTVVNSPGLIDSGYRGEVMVGLINHHPDRTHIVERGDKIAQLLFTKHKWITPEIYEPDDEDLFEMKFVKDSARSDKGFGSSGK